MVTKLVLATTNKGKVAEISAALAKLPYHILPQDQYNVPECEETGVTFVENALIKARNACLHSGLPALADDSGIVVPSLNGEPGVYSARYAGSNKMQDNLDKLLLKLKDNPQRQAYFYCCLVYMRHPKDPIPVIAEGIWHGLIHHELKGEHGFGYDPLFFLPDYQMTAAELPLDLKNQLSHRAQALNNLIQQLKA